MNPLSQQVHVELDYRDYSLLNASDEAAVHPMLPVVEGEQQRPNMGEAGRFFSNLNFPDQLHYILSEIENDGLSHVVSWQPHGRCFKVHDQKLLVEKVLCRYDK
jgi:HSF-type DNA-binding